VERCATGGGVGEDAAEGEHVAFRGYPVGADLLGRHERVGADHRARRGQGRRVGRLRDPEVDDPRPVIGHDDVGGLEVAVDEPAGVDRGQSLGQRGPEPGHVAEVQRPVSAHHRLQGRPRDVRGDHPRLVVIRVGVDDGRGMEAADPPGRLHLAREALQELGVSGELGADHLHRDPAPARREAEEYLAHPAVTQPAHQPVDANLARVSSPQRIHRSRGSNPVPSGRLHDTHRASRCQSFTEICGRTRSE
jgi:hypothetical protein